MLPWPFWALWCHASGSIANVWTSTWRWSSFSSWWCKVPHQAKAGSLAMPLLMLMAFSTSSTGKESFTSLSLFQVVNPSFHSIWTTVKNGRLTTPPPCGHCKQSWGWCSQDSKPWITSMCRGPSNVAWWDGQSHMVMKARRMSLTVHGVLAHGCGLSFKKKEKIEMKRKEKSDTEKCKCNEHTDNWKENIGNENKKFNCNGEESSGITEKGNNGQKMNAITSHSQTMTTMKSQWKSCQWEAMMTIPMIAMNQLPWSNLTSRSWRPQMQMAQTLSFKPMESFNYSN